MSDSENTVLRKLLTDLRRRTFLRGLGMAVAGGAVASRTAWGKENAPQLVEITPNPKGHAERMYAVVGYVPGQKAKPLLGAAARQLRGMAAPGSRRLKLFHFNDMHNAMTVTNRRKVPKAYGTGHALSQMVRRVKASQIELAADEAMLWLTAGDDHTGGTFDPLLGDRKGAGWQTNPAYASYSAAGVDVAAIGNHEFDHGAKILVRGIAECADFPMVCANLTKSKLIQPGQNYFPAVVAVINGLRIGVIGVSTPVMKYYRKSGDKKLRLAKPIRTLAELYPSVANVSDVVVVLSHCGYGDTHAPPRKGQTWRFYLGEGDELIARALSKFADKPTLIIGGHTHTTLNRHELEPRNVYDGVVIAQAGARGKYLGELNMRLEPDAPTRVRAQLHPTKWQDDDDAASREQASDYDQEFERAVIEPLQRML